MYIETVDRVGIEQGLSETGFNCLPVINKIMTTLSHNDFEWATIILFY